MMEATLGNERSVQTADPPRNHEGTASVQVVSTFRTRRRFSTPRFFLWSAPLRLVWT